MNCTGMRYVLIFVLTFTVVFSGKSQNVLPDMLLKGTIMQQLEYIQQKIRIYEDYRAIREDMFQILKDNTLDSLNAAKSNIKSLKNWSAGLNLSIDSLKDSLENARQELNVMTKTKNSIRLLGLEVNKAVYNAVMWLIIAALAGILGVGFLIFKRNYTVTVHTKKESEDLKKEFEAYRKASREAREKMSMAHFNELKKLRGG